MSEEYRAMSGEQLRKESAKADRAIAAEVTRLRAHDPAFRAALDRALAIDEERDRRRGGNGER